MRVRLRCLGVPATLLALLGCGLAATAAQAAVDAPLVSAVSTSTDSWVTLPMGDLSDPSNTFWELFHAASGSSHWSLVTPPGVADNGGLVQSSSAGAALVGVLPSDLLRFSPLAQSADGGTSWVPAFLPGALAPVPDALAYDAAPPGSAIALLGGGRALNGPVGLSSWSPLVTAAALSRVSPDCSVDGLDGAALLPSGAPLIATGCRRGGHIGLFTRTAAAWRSVGLTLGSPLRGAATTVLRVQSTAATTTVLALASLGGRRALEALWQSGSASWTVARPLALGSGASVRSTAVNSAGDVAVLLGGAGGTREAVDIAPAGAWNQLPRLPARTTGVALLAGALPSSGPDINAFTVDGESLGVLSLTPSGEAWARVQSSQIPLAYGSSS
jgi:hypothetical protein